MLTSLIIGVALASFAVYCAIKLGCWAADNNDERFILGILGMLVIAVATALLVDANRDYRDNKVPQAERAKQ